MRPLQCLLGASSAARFRPGSDFLKGAPMSRHSFNAGWTVQPKISIFTKLFRTSDEVAEVRLPHDAMLTLERSADAVGGSGAGYFPGGAVEYIKTFEVPELWRQLRASVDFEGVYRDAVVFVNGAFAAQRPNGYAPFRVPLDAYLRYGEVNEIRVEARAHQDSRWYSGLGIHRGTSLTVTKLTHFTSNGIQVTTPDVDTERAVVEVSTTVDNEGISTGTFHIRTDLLDPDGAIVASETSPITVRAGHRATVRQRLYVADPHLWGVDHPILYRATSTLGDGTQVLEESETTFGIRTLQLDPANGLRINGEQIKLRGACIHHDNGILGAAAIGRAEERRIEILKSAGFNAIRSSHNMISAAMLEACDRLGMLVMDETFDMWTESKSPFDYSLAFPEWWERDVEAMIARDFNHPSVIMYSIGNEILDAGKPLGAAWGRALANKVRSLDDTRYVTNAISGFVATITELLEGFKAQADDVRASGNVNDLMLELHHLMDEISMSDAVRDLTAESHSVVDIVGHNYADERYAADLAAYPNRIVVGTETLANRIDIIWDLVKRHPHVVGDFTWTGWDYLGEAGIGRTDYVVGGEEPPQPVYPWLLAWCADIDITGYRRPQSYYREIVFGLRDEPYIAVQRPHAVGTRSVGLGWSWSDSLSDWTFAIESGTPTTIEVYSASDEVELLVNGESAGTASTGPANRFRAEFTVGYRPGKVTAIARTDGKEVARSTLTSAGQVAAITVTADRVELRDDDSDLAHVVIELTDASGALVTNSDMTIEVAVAGAGVLQGLGTARPVTPEPFHAVSCTTFEGRALAIIRPTGVGTIEATITSFGLPSALVTLLVV